MQAQMLAPAAVLVAWSLFMLVWVAATRFPAMAKVMGGISKARPGGRGQDLEGVLDAKVNWKSHNYTHLMEQPTLFYAIVVILAIMGAGGQDVWLAWGYVALRIIHSIWQATINTLPIRFTIFLASTALLVMLTISALRLTVFAA